MDISIIIVNFNSGEYLAGCLDSLKAQALDGLEVEHLVVDSRSTVDQATFLEEARMRGARIIAMDRNLGYAGGCNRGLRESSGRFVFFLNADVLAVGDCLGPLIEYLRIHPEAGLIEPRTFLDGACAFIIPEIHDLTRWELFLSGCARVSGRLAHRLSLRRVRRTLRCWQATGPISMRTLSGAFLGTRREVLDRIGVFDEGFPLFYEDTDLFHRMRDGGMQIVLVPEAQAVHLAHRSIATVWNEAMAKMRAGRERFIRKHMGRLTLFMNRMWERMAALSNRIHPPRVHGDPVDLGEVGAPPEVRWDAPPGPYLLELALDPHFNLAAGHFGEGNSHAFSPETWASLLPGTYYLRALEIANLREAGRWKIQKL
jgi:GT2 family glycosyltransferase